VWHGDNDIPPASTYHKFVKTTPKPRATKNSRGELPGVLLFLPWSVGVGVAVADEVVVVSGMLKRRVCECQLAIESQSRAPVWRAKAVGW
jgi:hypothetical protein